MKNLNANDICMQKKILVQSQSRKVLLLKLGNTAVFPVRGGCCGKLPVVRAVISCLWFHGMVMQVSQADQVGVRAWVGETGQGSRWLLNTKQ